LYENIFKQKRIEFKMTSLNRPISELPLKPKNFYFSMVGERRIFFYDEEDGKPIYYFPGKKIGVEKDEKHPLDLPVFPLTPKGAREYLEAKKRKLQETEVLVETGLEKIALEQREFFNEGSE
jgi:hypothetical protein